MLSKPSVISYQNGSKRAGYSKAIRLSGITAQTWIIVYAKQTDQAKADALKAFLEFVLTDGQDLAAEVNFAPLPAELDERALAQLDKITVG